MNGKKRRAKRTHVQPAVPAQTIGQRVQAQREQLFKAMGIVDCCAYASDSRRESARGRPDIAAALDAAHELLDRVAGTLGVLVDEDSARRQQTGADN